jgi:hypothetical protein
MCNKQRQTNTNDWKDAHSAKLLSQDSVRWAGIWYSLNGQTCQVPATPPTVQTTQTVPEWERLQNEGLR